MAAVEERRRDGARLGWNPKQKAQDITNHLPVNMDLLSLGMELDIWQNHRLRYRN